MALVTLPEAGDALGWSVRTMRRMVAGGYLSAVETRLGRGSGGGTQLFDLTDVYDAAEAYRAEHPPGRPWPKRTIPDTPTQAL